MLIEIWYQTRDDPATNFKVGASGLDGMPNSVMVEQGEFFSNTEIVAYFASDTIPAGWSNLSAYKKEILRRRLRQIKWTTAPGRTPQEWVEKRFPGADVNDPALLAIAQRRIAEEEAHRSQIELFGLDSNWGWGDMKDGGIITLDIPRVYYEDILMPAMDTAQHEMLKRRNLFKRRYRIRYENIYSGDPQKIADLRDPGTYVEPDRTTLPPLGQAVEIVT